MELLVQTEIIKRIAEKEGKNYREALMLLKPTVGKAIGMSWDKAKAENKMTWMQALEKTKEYLK